ncbi:hypothetical protein [Marinicrinis sediminis]|uniref:DUF2066 domain-containing protein n=1 Tax=Marinicrinis sediminis TaxID=1652465 RepID=A0ABW5RDN9_9BACL
MYKIILYVTLCVVCVLMGALQVDEEMAVRVLFESKHAVNRAAHAAAQQVNEDKLLAGVLSIDEQKADEVLKQYLFQNLRVGTDGEPLQTSYLDQKVEILLFEVVNESYSFPYTYQAPQYNFEVTLSKPGVVVVAEVSYPRTFQVLDPITWQIKGSSEMVMF